MLKKLLLIFIFQCAASVFFAQKTDSILFAPPAVLLDSTLAKTDTSASLPRQRRAVQGVGNFFRKGYPNPRKAVLLSLILPGAGQAYNRSWWKLPLVYGGLGGMIWLENNNLTEYRARKTAYFNKVNDLPVPQPYTPYDATSLKFLRDEARKNFELSSVLLGVSYLLITAEAFVDAQLKNFDVSDDLSLKIKPTLQPTFGQNFAPGIGVCLNLNAKRHSSLIIYHSSLP